jgi:DnaA family protein
MQLLAVLNQLDKASLTEQRALSVPFVKKTLDW